LVTVLQIQTVPYNITGLTSIVVTTNQNDLIYNDCYFIKECQVRRVKAEKMR